MPDRRLRARAERAPVLLERLGASAEPAEHVGAGGRQEVVPRKRPLIHEAVDTQEARLRPLAHRDRHGAVQVNTGEGETAASSA